MFSTLKQAREIVRKQEEIELQEKLKHDKAAVSTNPQENLEALIMLSKNKGSRFKIEGDTRLFTIYSKPDYFPLFIWATVIVMGLYQLSAELTPSVKFILTMVVLYVSAMVIYYKFSSTTYDITVDSIQKQIMLKSNNPIGKFIHSEIFIDFKDITEISDRFLYSKLKGGLNNSFTKVILHHNQKKTCLIYLPNGPFSKVDYKTFALNFFSIIKSGEEPKTTF